MMEQQYLSHENSGGKLTHGMIVAFSGTIQNRYPIDTDSGLADTDWHVCDGTAGTPDLRGRFILGTSDVHTMDATGGEETHKLTMDEMPVHSHQFERAPLRFDEINTGDPNSVTAEKTTTANPINQWASNTGGDKPHNNMPPYYALAYIMRL